MIRLRHSHVDDRVEPSRDRCSTRCCRGLIHSVLAGCDRLDMYDQPRYEALEASKFFGDGLSGAAEDRRNDRSRRTSREDDPLILRAKMANNLSVRFPKRLTAPCTIVIRSNSTSPLMRSSNLACGWCCWNEDENASISIVPSVTDARAMATEWSCAAVFVDLPRIIPTAYDRRLPDTILTSSRMDSVRWRVTPIGSTSKIVGRLPPTFAPCN